MANSVSAIVEYEYTAKEPDELDLSKGAIINNIKIQPGGWWQGTLVSNGKTGMFPDNFVRIFDTADDKSPVILRDKSSTVHRKCRVIYSYTQNNDDELSLAVGDIIEFMGEVEEGWWRGKLNDRVGVFPSNFVVEKEPSPVLANRRSTTTTTTTATTTTAATNPTANYTQISINNKISNRTSFHNSKEDLLNNSTNSNLNNSNNIINHNTSSINYDKDAPLLPPKPIREYCKVLYAYDPQNEDELELKIGEIITILTKDLPDKGWWKGELRGKIGVFPDNFVTMVPTEVSPTKENNLSSHSINQHQPNKVYIKKSGSNSSTHGSNSNINLNSRKDSFGSRDSLNDILNETGIPAGNVAAQRKSLENKNLDITGGPSANIVIQAAAIAGDAARIARRSIESQKQSETRKSMENILEEKKTPPPVLTKKPTIPAPTKKPTSVTSVAGNLLSGLTKKNKSAEQKLTTSVSHDSADGLCYSKQNQREHIPDGSDKSITIERMRSVDNVEFDTVERSSMLPDMRASRVKAPKRRPPSAAVNVIGETNNNNSVYLNGAAVESAESKMEVSPNNIDESEQLAKPKPREWEKQKAPWMAELKANVEKKKTGNEPKAMDRSKLPPSGETNERNSIDKKDRNSLTDSNTNSARVENSTINNNISSSKPINIQKRPIETNNIQSPPDLTKSMSAVKIEQEDVKLRPNSLSIRNRSISPVGRTSITKASSLDVQNVRVHNSTNSTTQLTHNVPATGKTTTTTIISSSVTNTNPPITKDNVCTRVTELEQKVAKLESTIQTQSKIIEELLKSLRVDDNDKIKGLKTESLKRGRADHWKF